MQQKKKNQPNTPRAKRDQPQPYQRPTTAERGKKKQKQGGDLGVVVEQGVRIEVGVHVHEEETQGETQTTRAWVSPAPERGRKRETSPTNGPNKQREREI